MWRDERNGTANTDIYGQLVKPDGTLLGAEIPISTDPESQTGASVSFDGTNFLIVWESRRSGSPELYDTYGKFVSRAGVPGTALLISQAPSPRWNPTSVAFDGTNYLAVWNRDTSAGNPTPSDWDIYARLVSRSGTFVGNELPITTAPGSQPFYGGVIYDGSAYVVSWIDEPTSSLKHRFFNRSGVPLGSEFSLFGSQGTRIPLGGFFLGGSQPLVLASFVDSSFSNGDVYGLLLPQHRLDVTAPFANGNFQLRLTGVPGLTYALQTTTNLFATNTVWTTLTASNTLGGTFNFTHTNTDTFGRRFYRAVLP